MSWATGESILDPTSNPDLGWEDYIGFSGKFYGNEKAQAIYRRYINQIVTRVNSNSKVAYKDDPTIMAWQLANEPRPDPVGDRTYNVVLFAQWVDDSAGYIKSLDPNHLVSIGSEGSKGSLNSLDNAFHIQKSPHVDYLTYHVWPKNWGWFDHAQPDSLRATFANTATYIEEHNALAHRLNKPAVLEEFGLNRDAGYTPLTAIGSRNKFYDYVFGEVQASRQTGGLLVGCNFWAWGGEGRAGHEDAVWQVGDLSYVGDPYAEHQGLNSVFDTDSTTLAIIKQHSDQLAVQKSK